MTYLIASCLRHGVSEGSLFSTACARLPGSLRWLGHQVFSLMAKGNHWVWNITWIHVSPIQMYVQMSGILGTRSCSDFRFLRCRLYRDLRGSASLSSNSPTFKLFWTSCHCSESFGFQRFGLACSAWGRFLMCTEAGWSLWALISLEGSVRGLHCPLWMTAAPTTSHQAGLDGFMCCSFCVVVAFNFVFVFVLF